jgi:hypothetical protein
VPSGYTRPVHWLEPFQRHAIPRPGSCARPLPSRCRTRLHHPHTHSGSSHSSRAMRGRCARHRPDRLGQDRRLCAASAAAPHGEPRPHTTARSRAGAGAHARAGCTGGRSRAQPGAAPAGQNEDRRGVRRRLHQSPNAGAARRRCWCSTKPTACSTSGSPSN